MDSRMLKKYNYDKPPDHIMPRTKNVYDNYEKYSNSGAHEIFVKKIKNELDAKKVFFEINLFPYDVKPPIKHSCLWYRGSLTSEEIENFLSENNIECITYFENPHHLKSVKEISHYHIFYY